MDEKRKNAIRAIAEQRIEFGSLSEANEEVTARAGDMIELLDALDAAEARAIELETQLAPLQQQEEDERLRAALLASLAVMRHVPHGQTLTDGEFVELETAVRLAEEALKNWRT